MNYKNPNVDLARRAQEQDWAQAYSSPNDMNSPLWEGTIDECQDNTGDPVWRRIWCADGTARRLPD